MLQQRDTGSAPRQGRDPVVRPALPDLTGIDLSTLDAMDTVALRDAVDDVLGCPGGFTGSWADGR